MCFKREAVFALLVDVHWLKIPVFPAFHGSVPGTTSSIKDVAKWPIRFALRGADISGRTARPCGQDNGCDDCGNGDAREQQGEMFRFHGSFTSGVSHWPCLT